MSADREAIRAQLAEGFFSTFVSADVAALLSDLEEAEAKLGTERRRFASLNEIAAGRAERVDELEAERDALRARLGEAEGLLAELAASFPTVLTPGGPHERARAFLASLVPTEEP